MKSNRKHEIMNIALKSGLWINVLLANWNAEIKGLPDGSRDNYRLYVLHFSMRALWKVCLQPSYAAVLVKSCRQIAQSSLSLPI